MEKLIVKSVEKFTNTDVEKSDTASEDYLTRQIVANSKFLELVMKAEKKIQKQGYIIQPT